MLQDRATLSPTSLNIYGYAWSILCHTTHFQQYAQATRLVLLKVSLYGAAICAQTPHRVARQA